MYKPPARINMSITCRFAVMFLLLAPACASAAGETKPAVSANEPSGRQRIIPRHKIDQSAASSSTSPGGWWVGTTGIALALAVFGGVVVTARKLKPGGEGGPLKVLSKTSLSPKHSVYLLKAGDRVLIVGTGPQGAPSLLGEMDQDVKSEPVKAAPRPAVAPLLSTLRQRVGGAV